MHISAEDHLFTFLIICSISLLLLFSIFIAKLNYHFHHTFISQRCADGIARLFKESEFFMFKNVSWSTTSMCALSCTSILKGNTWSLWWLFLVCISLRIPETIHSPIPCNSSVKYFSSFTWAFSWCRPSYLRYYSVVGNVEHYSV